jgi:hypothetical protein
VSGLYEALLYLHSYVRWWVVGAALASLGYTLWAGATRRPWSRLDERLARALVTGVDLQALLGLALYLGVSPLARFARAIWSARGLGTLWASELRFFGLLHPAAMLLAATVVHVAWVAARRGPLERRRRRFGAGVALALGLFLLSVPWPLLGHDRPWFRF